MVLRMMFLTDRIEQLAYAGAGAGANASRPAAQRSVAAVTVSGLAAVDVTVSGLAAVGVTFSGLALPYSFASFSLIFWRSRLPVGNALACNAMASGG